MFAISSFDISISNRVRGSSNCVHSISNKVAPISNSMPAITYSEGTSCGMLQIPFLIAHNFSSICH